MIAFVCAWEYNTGGGFDWYRTFVAADKAFEKEKAVCKEFADVDWKAFRYNVKLDEGLTDEEITRQIDLSLIEDCNKAEITYQAAKI